MDLRIIQPDNTEWDDWVAGQADGNILQSWAWGQLKAQFGWRAARIALSDGARLVAGAQVLFRSLPLRLGTLAYIPRGPLADWENEETMKKLWAALDPMCRSRRAILLKIEPGISDSNFPWPGRQPVPPAWSADRRPEEVGGRQIPGFRSSLHTIQPPRTALVDLQGSEEELLARMRQKTRYNIRLAARKGVAVRQGTIDDLGAFHALMQATGERDTFSVHSLEYYRAAFELFAPKRARLLLAQVEGEIVAGLMVFALGRQAWYFYGASGNAHRDKMPNYALQWEAMRWARSVGCATYDLWGIPDEDEATLEARYLDRDDGLWGVYRFKRGFGGRVVRYAGAFDRVYNPLLYRLYLAVLSRRGMLNQ